MSNRSEDSFLERLEVIAEGKESAYWREVLAWMKRERALKEKNLLNEDVPAKIHRLQGEIQMLDRLAGLPDELKQAVKGARE